MPDTEIPTAPLRFPLRGPEVWSPALGRLLLYFFVLAAAPALLHTLEAGLDPFGRPAHLGTALPVLTLLAGLLLLLWIRLRPLRLEPACLLGDALLVPPTEASARIARLRYAELDWLDVLGAPPHRSLRLGTRRGLRIALRERSFAEPDGFDRFHEALRGRLAERHGGAERLLELDAVAAEAAALRHTFPFVTTALVVTLAAAYAAQVAGGSVADPLSAIRLGGNAPALVANGELYRLATANLLHGGALHLYWNALPIAILGARLERLLGRAAFGLIAGVGALGGAAASAFAGAGLVSVGASTITFALVASVLYLNGTRADGVPPELRFPLPFALVCLSLIALSTFLASNVDHASHAGGFAAGLIATAAVTRRSRDRQLASARRGAVAPAALAVACLFAVGIAEGIRHARMPAATSFIAWAEALAADDAARPQVLNEVAWVIATTPEVPRDKLRLALAAAERASSLEPESTAIRDTLATAHFRVENLERAIRIERDIAALDDTPFFWSQLARFEWAHARRWGPLRLGEESFPMPRLAGGGWSTIRSWDRCASWRGDRRPRPCPSSFPPTCRRTRASSSRFSTASESAIRRLRRTTRPTMPRWRASPSRASRGARRPLRDRRRSCRSRSA
jgi:membrane associated rhomboid family serine protease